MKSKKQNKRSVPFELLLQEDLKNADFAAGYLSEVFNSGADSDEDFEVFFGAIEKVLKAQGITTSAKRMKLSRDAIYKAFNKHHNPTVKNFRKILNAAELDIAIVARKRA